MTGRALDVAAYRAILGGLAAPVTVVTAPAPDGPTGMTVSSFMSVSLAPPLVAVGLTVGKPTTAAVCTSERFAVNALGGDDAAIARRFAEIPSDQRFEGVSWTPGPQGIPVLLDVAATLCAGVVDVVAAGDHLVVLGSVVAAWDGHGPPLLRHASAYTRPEMVGSSS